MLRVDDLGASMMKKKGDGPFSKAIRAAGLGLVKSVPPLMKTISVLGTGAFDGYKALTVLDSPNEGITYCIQYHTDTVERYSDFYYKHLENIHKTHNAQFEERFALFHTLMEEIEL